ncbi:hypothetical protein SAMN05444397_102395 [Flavobacterium aquidurense]|uniref:Uncharacterized protein n=1 Tax=Flavobacterium frigidimaris TaxID=262320 RepID=A0ABX4BRF7_FLAFR|nr:hypothetical protein [Flavobacterium frigidimaris]OXA79152.1 hypothetical protein B0A65_11440 [Flavobacterium frigidimaris]SDY84176.1 hypothetical protein SAMN05444397_102395 [Flavobacterium aquidurense]
MSTSGLGELFQFIGHFLFIAISLTLLIYGIWKTGKTRHILVFLSIIVFGIYLIWVFTKNSQKNELEQSYVGEYELTKYKDCPDCILKLNPDNSYTIYSSDKEYESGKWKYFDDGDIFYVEFDNNGQLGYNEYEYRE